MENAKRAMRYEIKILGRISLESGGKEEGPYLCDTVNMSLSGAFVETGSFIPVGSLLKYSFCLPGMNTPINITGEIIRGASYIPKVIDASGNPDAGPERDWISSRHAHLNRYGIMFLDIKEEDKKALEQYFISKRRR